MTVTSITTKTRPAPESGVGPDAQLTRYAGALRWVGIYADMLVTGAYSVTVHRPYTTTGYEDHDVSVQGRGAQTLAEQLGADPTSDASEGYDEWLLRLPSLTVRFIQPKAQP